MFNYVKPQNFFPSKDILSWVGWCTPVVPALGRLKQENHEFLTSLGYIGRSCLKK
jgi:hypothetical protein